MGTTSAPKTTLDGATIRLGIVLVVGAMAVIFDSTIVNIAIGTLAKAFDEPVTSIQWVSSAYLLALAMSVPVTAWAGKRFGNKNLWLVALSLFLLGSIGSGLAWNIGALIAWRVVQGIGGGLLLPAMQNIMITAVGRDRLGQVMAVLALPAVLGPVLGPFLGGLIVNFLSWRWMFFVNIPLCVAGLVLSARMLPKDEERTPSRLDVPGLVLLGVGTALTLYGLTRLPQDDSPWLAAGIVTLGLALVVAFVLRARALGTKALVDMKVFAARSFNASTIALFVSGVVLYGAMLLMPLYFQDVRGASVLQAGIALVPQGIGTLLSRVPAGKLTDTYGSRYVVIAGFVLATLGTLPFAFAGADTSFVWLMAVLVVRGMGLGAITAPAMAGAYLDVPKNLVPSATVVSRTGQQVGNAVGAAVMAVALQLAVADRTPAAIAAGFHTAFWLVTILTALAIIAGLFLPRRAGGRPVDDRGQDAGEDRTAQPAVAGNAAATGA